MKPIRCMVGFHKPIENDISFSHDSGRATITMKVCERCGRPYMPRVSASFNN